MKLCLQCKKLYGVDMQFCTADGQILVNNETLEQETVSFSKKVVSNEFLLPTMPFRFEKIPPMMEIQATSKKSLKNILLVFAAIVFFSGSSIILTTIAFVTVKNSNSASITSDKEAQRPAESNTAETNRKNDSAQNAGNQNSVKPLPVRNEKMQSTTETGSKPNLKGYNGRVIMLNAIVRSAPTVEADEITVVKLGEPLKIGTKASPNSPWYRVETASGERGWMHGNMFEIND